MAPRSYRMSRRGESAAETRRRIVRATYELHTARGIAATSMRDIAQRADVAIGTVYHHFPSYDDVIGACGEYTEALTRPPGEEIFTGLREPRQRLRALVEALLAFYQRFPGYERVRADRDKFPRLERFLRAEEARRRRLIDAAFAPRRLAPGARAVVFALLDAAVCRALAAGGLSAPAAAGELATLLERYLSTTKETR